jgi:tellurite resistance protein
MLEGLRQAVAERTARRRARPFLEACMASCALVAIADGQVSLAERGRVDQILEAIDRLRLYDVHDSVDLFNAFVDAIVKDETAGRRDALAAIKEMRHDAGDAVLVVKIAIAVSRADGDFLDSERAQCAEIARVLGLDLADYV